MGSLKALSCKSTTRSLGPQVLKGRLEMLWMPPSCSTGLIQRPSLWHRQKNCVWFLVSIVSYIFLLWKPPKSELTIFESVWWKVESRIFAESKSHLCCKNELSKKWESGPKGHRRKMQKLWRKTLTLTCRSRAINLPLKARNAMTSFNKIAPSYKKQQWTLFMERDVSKFATDAEGRSGRWSRTWWNSWLQPQSP